MITNKDVAYFFPTLLIVLSCGFLLAETSFAAEEITVAVADFSNSTGRFLYDTLEKSVPEMLKTELSRIGDITVVERSKLESVLAEQALNQTGIIGVEDAQKVGQLVGAQYVIAGEITKVQSRLRIDAHIVQSQTGKVVGEKVTGPDEHVIEKMVRILAINIVHNLSGVGTYTTSEKITNYYAEWVMLSAVAAGAISLSLNSTYKDHWQNYESAIKLNEFDDYYNKANTSYKARNIMFCVTGILLSTGVSLWLQNTSKSNKILAYSNQHDEGIHWAIAPYTDPCKGGLGVQICYRW